MNLTDILNQINENYPYWKTFAGVIVGGGLFGYIMRMLTKPEMEMKDNGAEFLHSGYTGLNALLNEAESVLNELVSADENMLIKIDESLKPDYLYNLMWKIRKSYNPLLKHTSQIERSPLLRQELGKISPKLVRELGEEVNAITADLATCGDYMQKWEGKEYVSGKELQPLREMLILADSEWKEEGSGVFHRKGGYFREYNE